MKTRLLFKILTLTMTLLLFIMGCQEEELRDAMLETEQVETVAQEEGAKVDTVMGEDIPDIVERIASKTATTYSKVADLEGKIRFNRAMINMRQAKRVKNPDGVINYTFDLYPDDAPENAFYTLVVSRAENGTLDEPYVIGYEMTDADFDNFMAHDMDFRYFRAKQKFYEFDSFFTDSKNNRVGKTGDCGGGTIGSGGNSGGGHVAPGETFSFTYNSTIVNTTFGTRQNANLYNYHITIGDNGASESTTSVTANSSDFTVTNPAFTTPPRVVTLEPSTAQVNIEADTNEPSGGPGKPCWKVHVIDGRGYFEYYDCRPSNQLKGGTASKGTDCIVVNGGVSIEVNLAIKKINSLLGEEYKLNGKQIIALSEKNDLVKDIYDFLRVNKSEEDKAFVLEAAKAIEKGGSVDIINEIIKDSTFIGTKSDCVLKKLLNQTSYFKDVMDAFTNNNSEYKIKFEIKPLSSYGADAETFGPDGNNIITIRIPPEAAQADALSVAQNLLHEGAHAQLRRMIATGNKAEYNLSIGEYNWLIDLRDWWQDQSKQPLTTAAHDFMGVKYVNPIANAVRNFDSKRYPLSNYMYFGWEGLFDEGRNRGLITRSQFKNFSNLAQRPLTDNYKTSCD